jgi:hypothetical protein
MNFRNNNISFRLSDPRFTVEQGGLRISNVREEDEGTYTCTAAVVSTGEYRVRQIRFKVSRTRYLNHEFRALDINMANLGCPN